MEPLFSPHRRYLLRIPLLSSQDAQHMVSLLVSAIVGALTTGALATLIMLPAPAFAGASGTERPGPMHADPGEARTPVPVSGPQGLDLPPVCTCVLPQGTPD